MVQGKIAREYSILSARERCPLIYDAQNLWLEHYAFGRPEEHPERYKDAWAMENRERARVHELTMDAVREICKWGHPTGYTAEKLGTLKRNYLDMYVSEPAYWKDFTTLTSGDKRILERFVELEAEKVRPLYDTIKNNALRAAVISCMDLAVISSKPDVTKKELISSYRRCIRKVDELSRGK